MYSTFNKQALEQLGPVPVWQFCVSIRCVAAHRGETNDEEVCIVNVQAGDRC